MFRFVNCFFILFTDQIDNSNALLTITNIPTWRRGILPVPALCVMRSALLHSALLRSALLRSALLRSALLRSALLRSALLRYALQRSCALTYNVFI